MGLEQREMVERSLMHENGRALPAQWSRRTYVCCDEIARKLEPGDVIMTQWGAYWQVLAKNASAEDVTLLLDALRPTDLRTHNCYVTSLFGGTLI